MKHLLMIFSLLVSSYLVAEEFNEETYAYENFEYNIAFDLTKDWIKDSEENESAELALNFLSPLKKQFTVSVREVDSELSLNEFFETTLAKQEEEGTFSTQDKVVETVMIGDKEMIHMSALLVFDCFSVKTHVYFHVADGLGYYWAMFSQKLDIEFQEELAAIVKTVRSPSQSLPVMNQESEMISEEVALDEEKCGTCNCQGKPCEILIADSEEELVINPEKESQENLEPAEMLSLDSEVMVQMVVGEEPKPDDSDEVAMKLVLEDEPSEDDESDEVTMKLVLEDEPSEDDESDEVAC